MFSWNHNNSADNHENDHDESPKKNDYCEYNSKDVWVLSINENVEGYVNTQQEVTDVVSKLHDQACIDAEGTSSNITIQHNPDKTHFTIFHTYYNFLFPFRQRILYDIVVKKCEPFFVSDWIDATDEDNDYSSSAVGEDASECSEQCSEQFEKQQDVENTVSEEN